MRTTPRVLTALLLLAASPVARATVVEGSSTTFVTGGQQTRGGAPLEKPDLVTVIPAFELITLSARDIAAPGFDKLEITLSGWGAYDLAKPRFDAGADQNLTGDLTAGYVKASMFKQALTVRAGREYIPAGAGQMLQLDGGDLVLRLPGGISLSGFFGSPVAQRFQTRAGLQSWNPAGGDLAYGGRVGWTLPFTGAFGRGLDLGASILYVTDSGHTVRKDAGLDLRLSPINGLVIAGHATCSLYDTPKVSDLRCSDGVLSAMWDVTRKLFVTLDARHTSPDLFLSRNSILSVFVATDRQDWGGGVRYKLSQALSAGADYHLVVEPGEPGKHELGQEAVGRLEWERGATTAGAEVSYLATGVNLSGEKTGYTGGRLYGRQNFDRVFVVGDVSAYAFKAEVNGQKSAVTGTVAAGYQLASNWSVVAAGRAGVTPFLEQQADIMVKLVYANTYRVREVK